MSDGVDSGLYNQWVAPTFSSDNNSSTAINKIPKKLPTAAEIENIYNQAYEEGKKKGYDDGLKKVNSETQGYKNVIKNIINAFDDPYKNLSDDVIYNIKKLSLLIAGQIIRREISIDDSNIVATVQKSINLIKHIDSKITIRINPLDISIVKKIFSMEASGNINLEEDPSISRGGCKIESKSSCIDATIEEQLKIITLELIGGSRRSDS